MMAYLNFTFGNKEYDITFDDSEFSDFVNDFYKYTQEYEKQKKKVDEEWQKDFYNAYKTAIAKIYIEYGETFTPLYKAYYDYVKSTIITGENCDGDCFFEKCFSKKN